ncbi:DUF3099 domain-containing protein [Dietzia sp.]|uniref:DUF3099 domain-containing protein n=1 Tax=Dietzia sp. TaxID=1871616 RepID=UPI003FA5405C
MAAEGNAKGSGRSRRARGARDDDTRSPVLITGARKAYEEELRDRKRRYIFLMSLRIPALVLAALALMIWDNGWIALAIVGFSIPIPWIAVLGANDRPKRSKNEPRAYARGSIEDSFTTRQLGPGGVVYTSEGTHSANSAATGTGTAGGSAGADSARNRETEPTPREIERRRPTADADDVIEGEVADSAESPGATSPGSSSGGSTSKGDTGRRSQRHSARTTRKAP